MSVMHRRPTSTKTRIETDLNGNVVLNLTNRRPTSTKTRIETINVLHA